MMPLGQRPLEVGDRFDRVEFVGGGRELEDSQPAAGRDRLFEAAARSSTRHVPRWCWTEHTTALRTSGFG
jgi:hypothetical protein